MQTAIHLPNFKHRVGFVNLAAVSPVSVGPSERCALTCSLSTYILPISDTRQI